MLKPIEYVDKKVDLSASDFNRPNYQLWISKHCNKNKPNTKIFNAAFVGSLIHQNSEQVNEVDVIKEYSTIKSYKGYTIGGTIDRLEYTDGRWEICDIKSGGQYPMLKKYKDEDNKEWAMQLSVYYWLLKDIFNLSPKGKIYAYVLGHQRNKDQMLDEWTRKLSLYTSIDNIIDEKINVISGDKPEKDCPKWLCDYCDYSEECLSTEIKPKEFS